jgi:hypothetical protein
MPTRAEPSTSSTGPWPPQPRWAAPSLDGASRLSAATARVRHGSPEEALDRFADLVLHWYDRGDWTHQWSTLRNLIALLAALEEHEAAAVLLGGVQALDGEGSGDEAQRLAAARAQIDERLGAEAGRLRADGAVMTPTDSSPSPCRPADAEPVSQVASGRGPENRASPADEWR